MQVNDSETNEEVDNSLNNFKVEFEKLKLQTHKKLMLNVSFKTKRMKSFEILKIMIRLVIKLN